MINSKWSMKTDGKRLNLWFFNGKSSCIFFHSFIFLCVWLKIGLSSCETLFFNFPPHSCESNVTSFTVSNHAEVLLLCGPVEDDKERLSVTGEGGWLKKTSGWKEPEREEAEADGRAMQRRSIVPADLAEAFHGCSRGDVTRNQEWKSKQKKRLSADGVA